MAPDRQREDTGAWLRTGSARHPSDSEPSQDRPGRYPADSERSQDGPDGDQTDSDRTQSSRGDPSPDSVPDFARSMVEAAARKQRDERNRTPGTWMPGPEDLDRDPEPGDETDFGTDGPKREYTSRQLGIRLRPKHFERLLEAARLYGVRPTTMARMMIVRGTNAIYDAELRTRARELKEFGSE